MFDGWQDKLSILRQILLQYQRVVVAYSGGTDSALLLAAAQRVLGASNVLAITAVSETFTPKELVSARHIAAMLGVEHWIFDSDELNYPPFIKNDLHRCFHCKYRRYRHIKEIGVQRGLIPVEGSNADDGTDYRPGMRAVKLLQINSPLSLARLTKEEIRQISRRWGLPSWNTPSQSCLATRIAYGTPITVEALKRIAAAEQVILDLGVRQVRVRDYGNMARIEVCPQQLNTLFTHHTLINKQLKKLGFAYVTVDMAGYNGEKNIEE